MTVEKFKNNIPTGILKYISMTWLTDMLLHVKKQNALDQDRIPQLPESYQVDGMERKMSRYFEEMGKHIRDRDSHPRPRLIRYLFQLWAKEYLITFCGALIDTCLGVLFPLLVQQLILYVEGTKTQLWVENGYLIVFLIIFCQVLMTVNPLLFCLFQRCENPTIALLRYACVKKHSRISLAAKKVILFELILFRNTRLEKYSKS
jgi:hypothetical protein